MISSPSTSQLLRSVSAELRAKVLPALADPVLLVELEMMLSTLDMAAVRADHEIEWMLQEADEVAEVLSEVAGTGALPAPAREALATLRASAPAGLGYAEVQAHYALAGAALGLAAEDAHAGGPVLQQAVWSLLERRVQHEMATIGAYVAVGRSENQS
jgi:hypothetical protein